MSFAVISGFIAAFLSSCSYVFSKRFTIQYKSSFHLLVYSYLWQALLAIPFLMFFVGRCTLHLFGADFLWQSPVFLVASFIGIATDYAMFRGIRVADASRFSSLLGLKIMVTGFFCMFLFQQHFTIWNIVGIVMAVTAAVGLNFAGAQLSKKALFYLVCTLLGYSIGDITCAQFVLTVGNVDRMSAAITAISIRAIAFGVVMLFFLLKRSIPKNRQIFVDAFPHACSWFLNLFFLFYCFENAGLVYGSILQSTRGVFSVILGFVLFKLGFHEYGDKASKRAWIRRFAMSILMVAAIVCYRISDM